MMGLVFDAEIEISHAAGSKDGGGGKAVVEEAVCSNGSAIIAPLLLHAT